MTIRDITRLFRPLDYTRIKHSTLVFYSVSLPLLVSLCITAVLLYLPLNVNIIGDGGLVALITDLLQILTGFYIASLAAVATFDKEGMDQKMPGGTPPTLEIKLKGKNKTETLTRRRFLCLLFGYLSFLSIFLYFLGSVTQLLEHNVKALFAGDLYTFLKWSFVEFFLFLSANLIVTTLLGLFYMVDRIHRD